jgi:ABC-type uncharacterized transport system substrate-binding protein
MKRLFLPFLALPVLALLWLSLPAGTARAATILFVNSYHEGYEWSDDIQRGIEDTLAGGGHRLVVHYMDTKVNQAEAFKVDSGRLAWQRVDEVKPQVIITADDNAVQYLFVDHLADGSIPVVFCGVNWDAAKYKLPHATVTGVVEVPPVQELLAIMGKIATGHRISIISANTESEKIQVENIVNRFPNVTVTSVSLVSTMDAFEKAYRDANDQADMILFINNAGIIDWDEDRASTIIAAHAKVISGSFDRWMSPFVVVSAFKIGQEQGRLAAQAALKILAGTPPSNIPVVANREGRIVFNAGLARRMNVTLPPGLLAVAHDVIQ